MTADALNQAIELIRQGKSISAQPILRELTANEPHNIPAWFWYVETLSSPYERARVLGQCLTQNPENQQVKDALDYLTSMDSKTVPPPMENTNNSEKHINLAVGETNRSDGLIGLLKKRPVMSIFAGIVMILAVIIHLPFWSKPELEIIALLIVFLPSAFSNPFLVGFLNTFLYCKEPNATIKNGILEGALSAFIMVGIRMVIQYPPYGKIVLIYLPSLFGALIEGAFAGFIAVSLKKNNQKKGKTMEGDLKFQSAKTTQNEKTIEDKSVNTGWVDTFFYASYIFIVLGGIATVALMFYLEPDAVKILTALPFVLFALIGPSVQALIICIILGKIYRNILSGAANLLASLALSIGSAWVMLSVLPLKGGGYGGYGVLNLFLILFVSAGHLIVLAITIGLGWIINRLYSK